MRISPRTATARLHQGWRAYGKSSLAAKETRWTIAHAARGRLTATLLQIQLQALLVRPQASTVEDSLTEILEHLGPTHPPTASWVVHRRSSTARTIVHEIDGSGRLVGVVKIGATQDDKLQRERAVLRAVNSTPKPRDAVLPMLVADHDDGTTCAMRTRLDLEDIQRPPYAWTEELLAGLGAAINSLHRVLSAAPITWTDVGEGGVPSHGDVTAWNLFALGPPGHLRFGVIDLEEAALRPPWWDACRFLATASEEGRLRAADVPRAAGILRVTADHLLQYRSTVRGHP
jgi:hypothetical protein